MMNFSEKTTRIVRGAAHEENDAVATLKYSKLRVQTTANRARVTGIYAAVPRVILLVEKNGILYIFIYTYLYTYIILFYQ